MLTESIGGRPRTVPTSVLEVRDMKRWSAIYSPITELQHAYAVTRLGASLDDIGQPRCDELQR
jgi:hypothetical protein